MKLVDMFLLVQTSAALIAFVISLIRFTETCLLLLYIEAPCLLHCNGSWPDLEGFQTDRW